LPSTTPQLHSSHVWTFTDEPDSGAEGTLVLSAQQLMSIGVIAVIAKQQLLPNVSSGRYWLISATKRISLAKDAIYCRFFTLPYWIDGQKLVYDQACKYVGKQHNTW